MKTYDENKLVRFDGNWHSIVKESLASKIPIASSRQIVSYRNSLDFGHDVWQYGGWTREQSAYAPKEQSILIMNSMLLNPELAQKAVEADRNNKYLELSKNQYESFLRTAEKEEKSKKEKRIALILPSRDNFEIFEISPNKNYNFAEKLFGNEEAEKYFRKLDEKGIKSIAFYTIDKNYVDKQSNPVTTELWLRSLDCRSGLYGHYRNLDDDYSRAFGVRSCEPKASSAKISGKFYSEKELKTYVNILEGIKEGKIPNSKVEKVIKGLEKLI